MNRYISIFLSGSSIPAVVASIVVAVFYLIFKNIFGKKENKQNTVYNPSIPINLQTQLHIEDKQGFIDRINFSVKLGNYKEALHLCTIYLNHHGFDNDIERLSLIIKDKM